MSTIAFCALLAIVNLREENSSLRTNDLKYRYIKMVGNIDDRLVYDLEELIYKDKEGKVLKEMKKQIEDYERAIELKIRAEEQARLNKAKSVKLDKQIKDCVVLKKVYRFDTKIQNVFKSASGLQPTC
ncbi:MAG: hypothetical protein SNJ28_09645 [Rikenellaceae bacterium]